MNRRFVIRQFGLLLLGLCAALAVVAVFEVLVVAIGGADEWAAVRAMLASVGVGLVLGGGCWAAGASGSEHHLGRREALLLTAMTWLLGSVLAAVPFWLWAKLGGPTDHDDHIFNEFSACYFEAVSGLTTTGATVLGDRGTIEGLPHGLLLWRSVLHWLGGLGIVVLFVAVLPNLGVGAKKLFQTESSAQESGVRPRIGETARMLWLLYVLLTGTAVACFLAFGMSLFDAVNHAMSVLSTGGFSPYNASIGHYDSALIDWALVVFMLLAGVNFAVFYRFARGRWRQALSDVELRWYLMLKLLVALVVTFDLWGGTIATTVPGRVIQATLPEAARFGWFTTAALHTGTGFGTADYDQWPTLSVALLVGLMFIGGCAGSTAGGIKVVRVLVCIKVLWATLEKAFRPSVVRPIRLGTTVIDADAQAGALTYTLLFITLTGVGALALGVTETPPVLGGRADLLTCTTASLSTLANVGPGMGAVNAVGHYGWLSVPGKLLLSLWMVLGRLEIYAVFVLLMPRFWRGD